MAARRSGRKATRAVREGVAAEGPPVAPGTATGETAPAAEVLRKSSLYLADEDLDRLVYEERRLERDRPAGARRRGVTDRSAIVRRLIREHLPLPPGWVPR